MPAHFALQQWRRTLKDFPVPPYSTKALEIFILFS